MNRAAIRLVGLTGWSLMFGIASDAIPIYGSSPPNTAAGSNNPAIVAAAALYDGIRSETLANGLRVYLKPISDSSVVTTMVAYRVGSADEDLDNTGLSHYLEHLMFKGTGKIMPGDIDRLTLRNGGENNAYTSEDYTIYHFDFAADRWEAALEIEADRMRNLRIDAKHEFELEKGAVIEELKRDEDTPWDLEQKAILPLLFSAKGPYGHPVIGQREHVRAATAAVIKAHYDHWYYPNNASLIVCGGFDPARAMVKIKQLFEPIPKGELPARKTAREIQRIEPIRADIPSKFGVPRMIMGFNTVRIGDPGYYSLEVIQALLTGGKTGRFYRRLVEEEEIAGVVETSNSSGRLPGWFSIEVELLRGKNPRHAEQVVLAELKRLCDQPVPEVELRRAKQGILASTIFNRESVHALADTIARGVSTNDLDYLKDYLLRVTAVTAREVQETARAYLSPPRQVVVWSHPGTGDRRGLGATTIPDRPLKGSTGKPPSRDSWRKAAAVDSAPPGSQLANAKRIVLDNGLVLLLLENHRLPIVAAEAWVRNVRLHEPADKAGLASLMGRLLDEGTTKHSGPEIAELIENVGGTLNFSSSGGSLQVLTPDRKLGMNLLLECLTRSTFPKEAFDRERQRQLSEIEDAEQQPDPRAREVFASLVYGSHPLGRPSRGWIKTVEALKPANCVDFHRQLFVPNNTVMALVGDFDSGEVIADLKALVAQAKWERTPVHPMPLPAIPTPKEFTQKILTMPEAEQLHFYMGHPGIRRNNPDYFKLLVMDYVLGTGPGFTDRLSAKLRDREGLAYSVSANITLSAGEEKGMFTCYIGTDPRNFVHVKDIFLAEVARIRAEQPADTEVADAKKYLLGSLPFQLTTNDHIAGHLLTIERFGLGLGYFDHYRKAVELVTPQDVQAVAREYLDPDHIVLVAAGPIDSRGRVLTRLPAPRDK